MSSTQRTEIRSSFTSVRVAPVTNVNFAVRVGTAIPRSVTLHTIPTGIIDIVPAYRSYRYIVYNDEYIIIDPATYEIVEVVNF